MGRRGGHTEEAPGPPGSSGRAAQQRGLRASPPGLLPCRFSAQSKTGTREVRVYWVHPSPHKGHGRSERPAWPQGGALPFTVRKLRQGKAKSLPEVISNWQDRMHSRSVCQSVYNGGTDSLGAWRCLLWGHTHVGRPAGGAVSSGTASSAPPHPTPSRKVQGLHLVAEAPSSTLLSSWVLPVARDSSWGTPSSPAPLAPDAPRFPRGKNSHLSVLLGPGSPTLRQRSPGN